MLPASHQDSNGPAHRVQVLVHSRTIAQGTTPCSLTHSRANLALTLTKACAKPKNLITKHLSWLGGVLGCVWDFSKLQQASNGQGMAYL